MEEAFSQILSTGVVGAFLVIVMIYHFRTAKDFKEEMKSKSIAHAEQMILKDNKIQELNDQMRNDSIENVLMFKDLQASLKDLVTELKIRNNG